MSNKTNITINLNASNLAEAVGLTNAEFDELHVVINEVIKAEVDRANAEENSKGLNLLNIMNSFNERLSVAQILLITAFFTSETLNRMDRETATRESLISFLKGAKDQNLDEFMEKDGTVINMVTDEDLQNPKALA
mgnify:CR=1 FL=1